ncbi:MAG: GNAT family N-acetyltransferase [Desulfobacteraceae bacterium]|nr:MAG: GNAT family N-acetyltransferase [Desulfobacteraceae bacterium]
MAEAGQSRLLIEALSSRHDRLLFSCGIEALDRYLRRQASQDTRKHVAVTFVLVEAGSPFVSGFYTLSATSLRLSDLPESTVKKLPRYPLVPAILLGRLAVSQNQRGKGYGELLLIDALKRCMGTQDIGWAVILVEAKDEQAAAFYRHYHFIPFASGSLRLFLPRPTIASLIG